MRILVAGGSGFIGQAFIKAFQEKYQISVLGRDKNKLEKLFPTLPCFRWDELSQCLDVDVVLNLCGENIGARRWSEPQLQRLLDSRLIPTQLLAEAIEKSTHKPRLLNASGIGRYGLQAIQADGLAPAVDENTPLPEDGETFIERLSLAWETQAARASEFTNVTILRFGVVLAKHGGALAQIALAFKFGLGSILGSGQQAFAWVTLTDLLRALEFIIENPMDGAVNIVAGTNTQAEFAKTLAKVLHRPLWLKTPELVLKLLFGQMAIELLLNGQHVRSTQLREAGFEFLYDELEAALMHCYQK